MNLQVFQLLANTTYLSYPLCIYAEILKSYVFYVIYNHMHTHTHTLSLRHTHKHNAHTYSPTLVRSLLFSLFSRKLSLSFSSLSPSDYLTCCYNTLKSLKSVKVENVEKVKMSKSKTFLKVKTS